MTSAMFKFLLDEGLAEIRGTRIVLTYYGVGTLLHLQYKRTKGTLG